VALALLVTGRAAVAHAAPVAIAIVAPERCPPALRERIAEQVADVADDVAWSCLSRLDEDEPFRTTEGQRLQFWIDLTPATEARLTVRDGRSDRFVVRRIPLPRGLDEIGREELGQIVRSALLAVRAGPEETLTRAEARAEIARWPRRPPPPAPAPPPPAPPAPAPPADPPRSPGPPLAIALGAFGSLRAFAPQVPVAGEIGLGLEVGRVGPLGGWLEAAYQPTVRYDGSPVDVALAAVAGRVGLDVSAHLAGTLRVRLGAGAGITRTTFTPESSDATGTAGPPGAFSYLTARALAGWEARPIRHVVTTLTFFLDVVGTDVHYDLREPDGTIARVLVPHRFQPGVAFQISWSR
jgi:hypothetical protein